MLLHKVKWLPLITYRELFDYYVNYIKSKYGYCSKYHVVFDGYSDSLSTKSHTHDIRYMNTGSKIAAEVTITNETKVTSKREEFLRNRNNKVKLIDLLKKRMQKSNIVTHQSKEGDADTLIVQTTLQITQQNESVVVAADDTDVLVMLLYHLKKSMNVIYTTDCKEKGAKYAIPMWWDLPSLIKANPERSLLPFAHAWTGCDTTSTIFRQGKTRFLAHLKKKEGKGLANLFGNQSSTQEEIGHAGAKIMTQMYNGKPSDTLTTLRYVKWQQMALKNTTIEPSLLPPTERAAHFHALRVHLQVMQWITLDLKSEDPKIWGWTQKDNKLIPVKTDMEAAPDSLLNAVRCNGKISSKNTRGSSACSCVKNGLKCVAACGDCRGIECQNPSNEMVMSFEELEDENDDEGDDGNVFDIFNQL